MTIYKVKDETLEELSLMYKIPKNIILSFNKITEIICGDYIVIPSLEGHLYKVKPFDTIEKISKEFSIPADEILAKNNISKIFPFMEILIE